MGMTSALQFVGYGFDSYQLHCFFQLVRTKISKFCHAASGLCLKWSGRTNQGALSGPAGQCKVATVGPPLP